MHLGCPLVSTLVQESVCTVFYFPSSCSIAHPFSSSPLPTTPPTSRFPLSSFHPSPPPHLFPHVSLPPSISPVLHFLFLNPISVSLSSSGCRLCLGFSVFLLNLALLSFLCPLKSPCPMMSHMTKSYLETEPGTFV